MRFLIVLLALLCSGPAYAMQMIGFGAAAGACATQSTDQSYTATDSGVGIYGSITAGQSFVAGSTAAVYSISVRGLGYTGGSGNLVARIGTTVNLSSSYLGETIPQAIIFDEANNTYELLFPSGSRPNTTATNTYYITVINTGTTAGDLFEIFVNSAGAYANGVHYQGATTQHDMTDGEITGYDMRFLEKVCD